MLIARDGIGIQVGLVRIVEHRVREVDLPQALVLKVLDFDLHRFFSFRDPILAPRLSTLRGSDGHVAALGARHRAPQIEEIPFLVDLHDLQILRRDALVAHLAWKSSAWIDARRIRGLTDGARSTMEHRAMGRLATAEAVALHDALEALALAGAHDVNVVARFELRDLDLVSRHALIVSRDGELEEASDRLHAGLVEMT